MILVFLILLNFLLAIIVDAFSEIKNSTKERTGVPADTHSLVGGVGCVSQAHCMMPRCCCAASICPERNALLPTEAAFEDLSALRKT